MSSERINKISELLLEEISERFNKEPAHGVDIEFSESFSEILDRFIVLHIRMWKLEDSVAEAKDNNEVADLKRKIDYCFKDRRPKLIKAINSFLDVYVSKENVRKFSEENVKLYKGYSN